MLLSIVILSYNRPKELARILNKFIGYESKDLNIIIKDDVSPNRNKIEKIYYKYRSKLKVDLIYHQNSKNLGYDGNLLDSFDITESEYIFLLSDDDYVETHKLDFLLAQLAERKYSFYFTPYTNVKDGTLFRGEILPSDDFYKSKNYAATIYNSILFSGLVFNSAKVRLIKLEMNDYDSKFIDGCIYSQVLLALCLISESNSYGVLPKDVLILGGDGINYFGENESAGSNRDLVDRDRLTSNLVYQNLLLKVVERLGVLIEPKLLEDFSREYEKRLIGYALRVRAHGLKAYYDFFNHSQVINKFRGKIIKFVMFLLFVCPSNLSRFLYTKGVKYLRKSG